MNADDVAVDECLLSGGKTTVWIHGTDTEVTEYTRRFVVSRNIVINGCTISDGYIGLYLDRCKEVDVTDCIVRGNRSTGVLCTNLEPDVRLIACELSYNKESGLSTSYFHHYASPYGPQLYHCSIHDNGINGVRIVDPAWNSSLKHCRIF